MIFRRFFGWLLAVAAGFSPILAFAETVELVTYYPSTFSGEADRLHAGRATVGEPYSLTNPPDADLPNGTLLVAGPLGIGTAEPGSILTVSDAMNDQTVGVVDIRNTVAGSFANLVFHNDNVAERFAPQIGMGGSAAPWNSYARRAYFAAYSTPAAGAGSEGMSFILETNGGQPQDWRFVDGNDLAGTRVLITQAGNVGIGTDLDTAPPVSTFQVNGSVGFQAAVVNGSVTLNAAHNVVLCNNGAAMTVTLPPAADSAGRTYYIKKVSNNAATVTIDPNGNEGIDGQLSLNLFVTNDAVRIVCAAGGWYVISGRGEMAPHMAKMTRDSAQGIPHGVPTKIAFNNVELDVGGMADAAGQRFVIRRAGVYLIEASWYLNHSNQNVWGYAAIHRNGTAILQVRDTGWYEAQVTPVAVEVVSLAANDVIEMHVFQQNDFTATLNTNPSAHVKPRMSIVELRS